MWSALQNEVMDLLVKYPAFAELFSAESPESFHDVEPLRQLRDSSVHQHKHELRSTSLAPSDDRELRKLLRAEQLDTSQRELPDTDGEKVLGHDRTKPSASQPIQSYDRGAEETQDGRTRSERGSVDMAMRDFRSEDMKTFRGFRSVDVGTFSRSEDMKTFRGFRSVDVGTFSRSEDMKTFRGFRSVDVGTFGDSRSENMRTAKDYGSVDMRTAKDFRSVDMKVKDFRSVDMKVKDFRSVNMRKVKDFRSVDMKVKDCKSVDMRTASDSGLENGKVKDCGSVNMRKVKDFRSVNMRKVKDCGSVDMRTAKDFRSVDMKVNDCKSVDMRTASDSGLENGKVKDCGSVNMRKVKECGSVDMKVDELSSVDMRKVKDCGSVDMRKVKDCGSVDMKVDDLRSVDTRTTRDVKSEDGSDEMHEESEEDAVRDSSQHGSEESLPSVTTGFWKCMRCQEDIRDRYLVQVDDGRRVHERCLVCQVCDTAMDSATTRSIFLLHGNILCKDHYTQMLNEKRKSSVRCAECREEIRAGKDWVRVAGQQVYHVTCFACSQCGVQFANGAMFVMRNGRPVCHMHFSDSPEQQGRMAARRVKRTRTQFTDKQYRILQRYFRDGTNPDARRLETIASELGLDKRHVQVWFQNNRARQRKLTEIRHA